jgi:hypothetical protein
MGDEDIPAQWLVELGNLLNVAGDLTVGAAGRVRAAPTPQARALELERLREPLRRIIWGASTALVLLEEEGGVT